MNGGRRRAGDGTAGDEGWEGMKLQRARALEAYYLATPLFILADVVLNAPIRVSFLASPAHRWVYYAFCFGCGIACHRWPLAARPIAFSESSLNLLLLALSVMLPIWAVADQVMAGGAIVSPMTPAKLVNVMVSGTALVIAFHRNQPGVKMRAGRR